MKPNVLFFSLLFIFFPLSIFAQSWKELTEKGRKLQEEGKYNDALPLLQNALIQAEKEFGKQDANYATACNNLAGLYKDMGRYSEAEPLFKEALQIDAKVLGKEHPNYATSCNNLALLYKSMGRYADAEPLYKEARAIYAKVLGKEHPNYATSCNNLALLYWNMGRYADAEPLLKEATTTRLFNLKRNFTGLSEKEKNQYFATMKNDFEQYFSFVLKAQKPELYAWLLENTFATKGILFFSTNQLRRTLEMTEDKEVKELYEQWLDKRRYLAKAYEMSIEKRKKQGIDVDSVEKEANEMEKRLLLFLKGKRIEVELTPTLYKWQEVQQQLQSHEALIEMVRFRYYAKGWKDSVLYMGFVVRKDKSEPIAVLFPDGKFLEDFGLMIYNRYTNNYQNQGKDTVSYKRYFAPFEPHLKGISKLYFASEGVFTKSA